MGFSFPKASSFSRSQEYLEVKDGESESGQNESPISRSSQTYRRGFIISSIFNGILSFFLLLSLWSMTRPLQTRDSAALIKATSSYSPILSKIPLTSSLKTINGSFMSETNPPDIFRSLPSKEADVKWHEIGNPTWITISSSEAVSLGKDPQVLVRAPEDWGYGEDRYIAMLDLNHQLHCIDQLRRAAFRDEYPVTKDERWDFQKEHWMHCVHILKQNIVCTGSTEVITYNWRETQRFPVPDFDVDKRCKNTDAILGWQERNKVTELNKKRDGMADHRPEDAIVLPLPPRLKAFLGAHDEKPGVKPDIER